METKESGQKMTISDVAEALNISKTTVSRAISGKGRIGAETRRRVLEYIEEHNYKPSVIAKGLAQSKSYNIGWVMPSDYSVVDLPFFQKCLMGLLEMAAPVDYDVLVCTVSPDDMSQLERIVENHKVDGVVLGRTLVNDAPAEYLKEKKIPFVVVGSMDDDNVVQVDHDHVFLLHPVLRSSGHFPAYRSQLHQRPGTAPEKKVPQSQIPGS